MLQYGFARRCVTPAPECRVSLAGYFNLRWQTGKIDDIYTQAMAVSDGTATVILCQIDAVAVPLPVAAAIRQACAGLPGVSASDVVICASHSHTCPNLAVQATDSSGLENGGTGGRPSPAVSANGANADYNAFLVRESAAAIRAAVEGLRPGQAWYGECEDSRWAFNRRFWMNDGTVVTNPPRRDPRIAKSEGPIDPRIGMFGVRNEDGSWRFLLANVSNHPDTVEGTLVCADWPGVVRAGLEEAYPGAQALVLVSAQGNVNHFNPFGPDRQSGYEVITRRMGLGYVETILANMAGMRPLSGTSLRRASLCCDLKPREVPAAEVALARQHAAAYTYTPDMNLTSEDLATGAPHALKYFADQLLAIVDNPAPRQMPVTAWKIGELYLFCLPGEPFVEHAVYIREDLLRRQPCLITALTASAVGYVPNRFNYGRGGYETTVLGSPHELNAGHVLRDLAAELRKRLDSGI